MVDTEVGTIFHVENQENLLTIGRLSHKIGIY